MNFILIYFTVNYVITSLVWGLASWGESFSWHPKNVPLQILNGTSPWLARQLSHWLPRAWKAQKQPLPTFASYLGTASEWWNPPTPWTIGSWNRLKPSLRGPPEVTKTRAASWLQPPDIAAAWTCLRDSWTFGVAKKDHWWRYNHPPVILIISLAIGSSNE